MNRYYTEEILEKVRRLGQPEIEGLDCEIVDLKLLKSKGRTVIRFLVDKPQGGISLAECAQINSRLSRLMDKEDFLSQRYDLEVSSPGIDRPLLCAKDFLRSCGCRVRVFLNEPLNGKIEYAGVIDKVEGGYLFLNLGQTIERIQLDKIKKARQVIK